MSILLSLLLLFVPLQEPPEKVAGVVIKGELTFPEKEFLKELNKRMLPLPDTVKVVYRKKDNGSFQAGSETILISKDRNRSPQEAKGKILSLYGRMSSTPTIPLPGSYHTLAHEIAHLIQYKIWGMKPQISSPLWWKESRFVSPYKRRVETEAELIAAGLENIVFGTKIKNLGYPKFIWAGNTNSLVSYYKERIYNFYRVVER